MKNKLVKHGHSKFYYRSLRLFSSLIVMLLVTSSFVFPVSLLIMHLFVH
ncbi:MAG: hypothetical protein LBR37_00370 [Erysipelotrichaceae bacterium]|nr:hypothetical protein [Erysipelotrichaceae bacterium]